MLGIHLTRQKLRQQMAAHFNHQAAFVDLALERSALRRVPIHRRGAVTEVDAIQAHLGREVDPVRERHEVIGPVVNNAVADERRFGDVQRSGPIYRAAGHHFVRRAGKVEAHAEALQIRVGAVEHAARPRAFNHHVSAFAADAKPVLLKRGFRGRAPQQDAVWGLGRAHCNGLSGDPRQVARQFAGGELLHLVRGVWRDDRNSGEGQCRDHGFTSSNSSNSLRMPFSRRTRMPSWLSS